MRLGIRIYLYNGFIIKLMRQSKQSSRRSLTDLSPLEQNVLNLLWPDKRMRVRDIHALLPRKTRAAQTSVAVILDRLRTKGLVDRKAETCRGGSRYIYFPSTKKEIFEHRVMGSAIDSLIERFGSTAITYFEERFSRRRR